MIYLAGFLSRSFVFRVYPLSAIGAKAGMSPGSNKFYHPFSDKTLAKKQLKYPVNKQFLK